MKTRIAPTPSGHIHLGNAFNFKLIDEYSQKHAATLALRIDDFDKERAKADFVDDIFQSLSWLKISIEEGPKDRNDFSENFSILKKQADYWKQVKKLMESHQAYACNCSRSQKEKFSDEGAYRGHCRSKNLKFEKGITALRLKCPQETQNTGWQRSLNDFVIWTKDDTAAYQLVSVVEDTRSKTNVIIRGSDLADSSLAQSYLAKCLGDQYSEVFEKIKFLHHKLLLDPQSPDKKYSKSDKAHSLKNKISEGYTYDDFMDEYAKFKSFSGLNF